MRLSEKSVGILVPCYNEEIVLPQFYSRVQSVIESLESTESIEFHYIFVNDGSSDRTIALMHEFRKKNSRVHIVDLSRNFGKETAMLAGLDYCDYDAVVIMDADLQDPPELLPEMIYWWREGFQDVYAKRKSRAGETWLKKTSSHLYYKILQRVTNVPIQVDVGDFRLLDRQCVEALKMFRECQRYTKGMFSWIGFDKKEILFDRDPRAAGKTKWNYFKLVDLAIEGITGFTIVPLRFASLLGSLLAIGALFYMIGIIAKTLIFGIETPGYASMTSIMLFIGGVQLLFLGVIGEYLGRVFNESKHRPIYLVKEYDGEKIIDQRHHR